MNGLNYCQPTSKQLNNTFSFSVIAPEPYALLLLRTITPLLILLSRTHNAILFAFFDIQRELLHLWLRSEPSASHNSTDSSGSRLILTNASIILGLIQSAFFAMGNSNSLSSVDLGNAYIGVDEYNMGLTGLLTFVSNWAGSIWWTFAGISLIVHGYWRAQGDQTSSASTHVVKQSIEDENENEDNPSEDNDHGSDSDPQDDNTSRVAAELLSYYSLYYLYFAIFFNLALTTLTVSVTILRQHLFIWTVFSPKFLFQGAWVILYHFMLQTLLTTVVIGTWIPWCIT